jgi:hypothetical protein
MPKSIALVEPVESLIQIIRGQRVILDADLARVYGVPTKRLNEAVKRNRQRFPTDFMFRLTPEEAAAALCSRSQFATLKRGQNIKHLPHVFTEHGAIQAANVLNSDQAVQMGVFVVRAFVKMRETLAAHHNLAEKLKELERNLTSRLDNHEHVLKYVLTELHKLMNPPEPSRKKIGCQVRERRAAYRVRKTKS